MYSSAYSDILYSQKPLNYEHDSAWLDNIATQKDALSDSAYQQLNNLKAKALNIRFMSPAGQEKVNQYNNEISNFFKSNNLNNIDLSDYKNANAYAKIFDNIASDKDLNYGFFKDKEMQNTNNQYIEAAKNPGKSGFNKDNYNVWMHEHLQPYMKETNLSNINKYSAGAYDAGYDYQKEIKGLKGDVHFDGNTFEFTKPNGEKEKVDKQALTAEKLNTYFMGTLSANATNQILTEGKSAFYKGYDNSSDQGKVQLVQNLYDRDKAMSDANKAKFTNLAAQTDGKLKVASPDQKQELENKKQVYLDKAKSYTFDHELKDYQNMDQFQLANQYAASFRDIKINHISQGMSYEVEKITNSLDPVYAYNNNYNLNVNKFNHTVNQDAIKNKIELQKLDIMKMKYDHTNSKGDKTAPVSDMYSHSMPGKNSTGFLNSESISANISEYANIDKFNPLTDINVKMVQDALMNSTGAINADIAGAARMVGLTSLDVPTQAQLGTIQQFVLNQKEQGNLKDFFALNKIQLKWNVDLKDKSWNLVIGQFPGLQAQKDQKGYLDQHPSLKAQIYTAWNQEIAKHETSANNEAWIMNFDKEKSHIADRNREILVNVFKDPLNKDIVKKLMGKYDITNEMISSATVYPDNLNPQNSTVAISLKKTGKNAGGDDIVVKIPPTFYESFKVGANQLDKFYMQVGSYENSYKGINYRIYKSGTGSQYTIKQPGKEDIESAGKWFPDKSWQGQPEDMRSLTDIKKSIEENIEGILKK